MTESFSRNLLAQDCHRQPIMSHGDLLSASVEKMTENKAHETRVFELHCKRTKCTYSILAGDLSQEEQ